MYPSRQAPLPPSPSPFKLDDQLSLSPDHPFATYYIPPPPVHNGEYQNRQLKHYTSESSFNSNSIRTPSSSRYYESISSSSTRSPTSSLSQPLSPRSTSSPRNYSGSLGHFATQQLNNSRPIYQEPGSRFDYDNNRYAQNPAYSRSTCTSRSSSSILNDNIPIELTLFNSKPKQNLLGDIEYIIGKKLSFPFLESLVTSRKDKKEKEQIKRLTKERYNNNENWDWECLNDLLPYDSIIISSNEKQQQQQQQQRKPQKKGRGVREGNFI
ncbi:uncharacterized protein L201_000200 [Kwoniella dendrophila CBS 6074]|uniref:AGC-kinase C-terminal domain-containing protein n=1 Tax=Kwoniella dendrophila CBS 6074 TaxID=1295534 RepID=A0AAX4JIP3_9TREE